MLEHRPVAALLPQRRDCSIKVLLVNLGQHFLAEVIADAAHLLGNGGIFVGQICMVCTGVDDAQGMTASGEVKVHRLNDGIFLIQEINSHQAAHSGSRLIHQTAGLAEVHILGILADPGDLRLGYLAIKEQAVDDGADEHLIGSGRRKTGAGQHRGLHIGIKALYLAAKVSKPGCHTPDQRRGGVDFLGLNLQIGHIHLAHGIPLGLDADHIGTVDPDSRICIQIYRRSQHMTPLMVCMVTANFRTAGSGKIPLRLVSEGFGEAIVESFPEVLANC